jgi:hypothetical protein
MKPLSFSGKYSAVNAAERAYVMPSLITDPCDLPASIPVDEPAPLRGFDQFNKQRVLGMSKTGGRTVLYLNSRKHKRQSLETEPDAPVQDSDMRTPAIPLG